MSVPKETINESDIAAKSEELITSNIRRYKNGSWSIIARVILVYILNDGREVSFVRNIKLGNAIQKGRKPRK